jgi:hypothetical protein
MSWQSVTRLKTRLDRTFETVELRNPYTVPKRQSRSQICNGAARLVICRGVRFLLSGNTGATQERSTPPLAHGAYVPPVQRPASPSCGCSRRGLLCLPAGCGPPQPYGTRRDGATSVQPGARFPHIPPAAAFLAAVGAPPHRESTNALVRFGRGARVENDSAGFPESLKGTLHGWHVSTVR